MPLTLEDRSGLDARSRTALEQAVSDLTTLERVLEWTREADLGPIEEIVTQDEYTHDVVVPWRGGRYLVFDTS